MRLLAAAMGLIIAVVGGVGVVAPSVLLEFGRSLQTPDTFYIVTGIRVIFGAILLWVAAGSRMPKIIGVIGVLIIVAVPVDARLNRPVLHASIYAYRQPG